MNSKDIYSILLQKCPKENKNIHYLKRYVKFIFACIEHNKIHKPKNIERHHILPKGKTFWPEYKSFKDNPWNEAKLTYRQHFIAHYIFAKAYGGHAISALVMMCKCVSRYNPQRLKINSRLFSYVKENYRIQPPTKETIEKMRISKIGVGNYKDSSGKVYRLKTNDPKIKELNLVGTSKGYKFPGTNKGYVTCVDKITGDTLRVTREEFDSNNNLAGVNYKTKGTCKDRVWINKNEKYKIVKSSDLQKYINDGWVKSSPSKGRKSKHFNGVWMTNKIDNVRCSKDEISHYESLGYELGRKKGFKQKKIREIVTCPHCGKKGKNSSAMQRFHFDNCKSASVNTLAV